MKSNYNSLGKYIRVVSERNSNLQNQNLIGLSIEKKFIPSISNTIGTDMSTYRIINTNQFAYSPVTSRNGDKITIALYQGKEEAMISQAYTVFEIIDTEKLLPEYLMMWFRRTEFDRYARFMSHGSAREIFEWDSMRAIELPVTHINTQKEIVKEYNTIVNRIKLNEQLCQKLEETAQTIYKHWFVDFEFPNENGKPYKSSGGEMVFNEVLEKEIPKAWEVINYKKAFDFKTGKLNSNAAVFEGKYPFFTCSSETYKTNTFSFDTEALILAGNNASAIYPFKYYKGKFDAYQRTYIITPKENRISIYQGFFSIQGELENFKGISSGTATKFLTMKILDPINILLPDKNTFNYFDNYCRVIFNKLMNLNVEKEKLQEMKSLLLSKLATKEN